MRLTIKKKSQPKPGLESNTSVKQKLVESPCCNSESEGKRFIFFRPHNKQEKVLYDLIKIDCQLVYSKVSPTIKSDNLHKTIIKTISELGVRYEFWIGYLCAHCSYHFQSQIEKTNTIQQFVQKFRPAFEQGPCADIILMETFKRLKQYCSNETLNPSDATLLEICRKYQETLLLEFLPVKYSRYIIQRYLSNDGDIDQYVKLCTSLAHFILGFTNPVKESHFVDLMHRPYMGTIEWPVIIANRFQFSAETTEMPLVQRV